MVDIPKDVQFKKGNYKFIKNTLSKKLNGGTNKKLIKDIEKLIKMIKEVL